MNRMQEQVLQFHLVCHHKINTIPQFAEIPLRVRLMTEEFNELLHAILKRDMVLTADAICDLLYVVIGTAITFGINIEPIFDEVHRSNMEKRNAGKDSGGKQLKPMNWSPPNILALLQKQGLV